MLNGTYPIFDSSNVSTIVNTTYQNGQLGATPLPIFLILLGAAMVLLILAFKEPLRDAVGSINVAKVGLSICGTIVNGVAALSSFDIVENMGSGVSTYETYTTAVSSYTIWMSPYVTGLLIVSGVLCFAMFIYSVTQPAIAITPDRDDYRSKATGERR